MSLTKIFSRTNLGIAAPQITVETHLQPGLPGFSIVGLPETVVKESKDRVHSALLTSGFEFPDGKITVNLAPADLPKHGGCLDLPIAIGILSASQQIKAADLNNYEFAGELSLSGELRSFSGVLPFTIAVAKTKRNFILPLSCTNEASIVADANLFPATHLIEVVAHLNKRKLLTKAATLAADAPNQTLLDFADVKAQAHAKRALEIAAAGNHSILLYGPPGTGKTMLAERLPSILPELSQAQALETAALASISGKQIDLSSWKIPPFRAPHHTASAVALVGGGSKPKPGEISLAHNGVLFLDELPEFDRKVLEVLREPLESNCITISRAARSAEFPAKFQLIAAMNPCPCGYLGDKRHNCSCSAAKISRYRHKLSGPLLDRIDMHLEVPGLLPSEILAPAKIKSEPSASIKARVLRVRKLQLERNGKLNSALGGKNLSKAAKLNSQDSKYLEQAMQNLGLSARSLHRVLRLARTIADMQSETTLAREHLLEALSYRSLDRQPKFS